MYSRNTHTILKNIAAPFLIHGHYDKILQYMEITLDEMLIISDYSQNNLFRFYYIVLDYVDLAFCAAKSQLTSRLQS